VTQLAASLVYEDISWTTASDALPHRGRQQQKLGLGLVENEKGFVGFGLFVRSRCPGFGR
jgi:hypothetical protein